MVLFIVAFLRLLIILRVVENENIHDEDFLYRRACAYAFLDIWRVNRYQTSKSFLHFSSLYLSNGNLYIRLLYLANNLLIKI